MTKETNQILLRLCIEGNENPKGTYTTDLGTAKTVFTLSDKPYEDKIYSIGSEIELDGKPFVIKNISYAIHSATNDYSRWAAFRSVGELNPFNSTVFFDVEPK